LPKDYDEEDEEEEDTDDEEEEDEEEGTTLGDVKEFLDVANKGMDFLNKVKKFNQPRLDPYKFAQNNRRAREEQKRLMENADKTKAELERQKIFDDLSKTHHEEAKKKHRKEKKDAWIKYIAIGISAIIGIFVVLNYFKP